MQAFLKFLIRFLNQFLKNGEDTWDDLPEDNSKQDKTLESICTYALSKNASENIHWDHDNKTMNSPDKKEFNIWYDRKDNMWKFKRIKNKTEITTEFFNNHANNKLLKETINELSERSTKKLIYDFDFKCRSVTEIKKELEDFDKQPL